MIDETLSVEQVAEQPSVETTVQPESQKEINFRTLRERAEKAEKRALELERALQTQPRQPEPIQEQYDTHDDIDIDDNEYVEGKKVKKYLQNLRKETQELRKQFVETAQRSQATEVELKLKSQYSDFDSVVNETNLKNLAALHPDEFSSIAANPNLYGKAKTAYTLIKSLGVSDTMAVDTNKKLDDNRSKPKNSASVAPQASDSPLTRVGDYDRRTLTEERKEQLRKQVAEAKKFR